MPGSPSTSNTPIPTEVPTTTQREPLPPDSDRTDNHQEHVSLDKDHGTDHVTDHVTTRRGRVINKPRYLNDYTT